MSNIEDIATDLIDVLPNPVLVKDDETRYLWVNRAFERLFEVRRDELVGRLDSEVFPDRQVAQCNGGDLRVLATGEIDEADEVVVDPTRGDRQMITRKTRLSSSAGNHVLLGVMHDITDVTEANHRLLETSAKLEEQSALLRVMANTDGLTGCLNRRALFESAASVFAADDPVASLLVLDLDHFKTINDTLGHDAGDRVLEHFVQIARGVLRSRDLFARTGGEEFAILLPDTEPDAAVAIANRICETVRQAPTTVDGHPPIDLTVSIGVAHTINCDEPSIDGLIKLADRAMYEIKHNGRDGVGSSLAPAAILR